MAGRISSPVLIGREEELRTLTSAIRPSAAATPFMWLVSGEAGIGKTRLTRELEATAEPEGVVCLRGHCLALAGGEFPFAPLVGVFRTALRGPLAGTLDALGRAPRARLASVLPTVFTGRAAPGRVEQAHVHETLLGVLERMAATTPLALVVEDLHWADESTADLLRYLARNLTSPDLKVVTTYRSDELTADHPVRSLVAELVRCDGVRSIELQRLTRDETSRQIEAIAGTSLGAAAVTDIHRRSDGNPFLVEELLATGAATDSAAIGPTLRDVLLARVRGLPAASHAALRLLAAVGRPVEYRLLVAAMRPGTAEPARAGLREALDRQVLVASADGERIAFRHALAREVLYADLLPDERQVLHASIAAALAEADPDGAAAEVAYHQLVAGALCQALVWSVAAGRRSAAQHAYPEALGHFTRALELAEREPRREPPPGVDPLELLAAAADAARLSGEYDRASELCRKALTAIDPDEDPVRFAEFHERLARNQSWDVEGSLEASRDALARLPVAALAGRARLMTSEARALGLKGLWPEARRRAEEALDVAVAARAKPEEGAARAELGLALAFIGDCDAATRQVTTARSIAEALGTPDEFAYAWLQTAEIERLRGNVPAALDAMNAGRVEAARLGASASWGAFMAVVAGNDLFWLGRWSELAHLLEETADAHLSRPGTLLWTLNAGRLALARGEVERAAGFLTRSWEAARKGVTPEFVPSLAAARAELELWCGRPEVARTRITEGVELVGDQEDPLNMPVLYETGVRAECEAAARARLAGHSTEATAAQQRARDLADRLVALFDPSRGWACSPIASAYLTQARAELSGLEGDPAAAERWDGVARLWDELAQPYVAAFARYRSAEARLLAGSRSSASDPLRTAHSSAEGLCADILRREIEALARRARVDLAGPSADAAADGGAPQLGLTAREIEVLQLVAEGLTNRQIGERLFITPKTAGLHVSHILAKLDVDTRVKAAAVAHRSGVAPRRTDLR